MNQQLPGFLRMLAPMYRPQIPHAGLLEGATAPPDHLLSSRRPDLFGRVGQAATRLFGGPNDPNLTAEQNAQAAQQARLQAGLQMILASRSAPGAPAPGLMQVLAGGALVGQQAGAIGREQMLEQQRIQEKQRLLKEALGSGQIGPLELRSLFAQAVQLGDTEAARAIATVVQAVESAERPRAQAQRRVTLLDDEGVAREYLVNPDGSKVELGRAVGAGGAAGSRSRLQAPRVVQGPDGRPSWASFDPDTGQMVPVEGPTPITGSGSEGERKAAAFASFIPEAVRYVDQLTSAPGRVEQALSDQGIREFTSAEQQQLQLAGAALAEAWLRMTTGAAYNTQEFENAMNLFVPRPGDRAETLRMKKRNRERLMEMLRTQAGRARVGGAPAAGAPDVFGDLVPGGGR